MPPIRPRPGFKQAPAIAIHLGMLNLISNGRWRSQPQIESFRKSKLWPCVLAIPKPGFGHVPWATTHRRLLGYSFVSFQRALIKNTLPYHKKHSRVVAPQRAEAIFMEPSSFQVRWSWLSHSALGSLNSRQRCVFPIKVSHSLVWVWRARLEESWRERKEIARTGRLLWQQY